MKNTKIVLAIFFLLFLTGILVTGITAGTRVWSERGLIRFEFNRRLTPEALNRNFEIIDRELDRLTDMFRNQEYEIRRLRSNESRLRYDIDYLYKSAAKGEGQNAEDWRRNILPEVENVNRDLGVKYKK